MYFKKKISSFNDLPNSVEKNAFSKIMFFLVIMVILCSDDSLMFGTNIDLKYRYFKYAYIFLSLFIFLYSCLRKGLDHTQEFKEQILILLFMIVLMLICMVVNKDYTLYHFYKILLFIQSFLFIRTVNFYTFVKCFNTIIYTLAIFSVIINILNKVDSSIFAFFPQITNSADHIFTNCFVCVILPSSDRNFGIFREPGVYQVYLNLFLIFHIFFLKQIDFKRFFWIMLALALTGSSSGMIVFFVLFTYLLSLRILSIQQKRVLFLCFIFVSCLFLFQIRNFEKSSFDTEIGSMMDKITTMNNEGSGYNRFSSLLCNARITFEHPFFGVGYEQKVELLRKYSGEMFDNESQGGSNTFMEQAGRYGIVYLSIWLVCFWRLSLLICKNRKERFLVFILFLLMLSSEAMETSALINVLLMYGLSCFSILSKDELSPLLKNRENFQQS